MRYSVKEIAAAIGAQAFGDTSISIKSVAEPQDAGPAELALATNPKYADGLAKGEARAAMLWPGADWEAMGLEAAIIAERGRLAMSGLTRMMDPGQHFGTGVHPTAIVHESAEVGAGTSIGPFSIVGARARIGANSIIGPHCSVGADATIGKRAYLREGVGIGARVTIGDRFIAQPGARIGSDGMSFVTPEASGVEKARESLGDQGAAKSQSWARIHSLGAVTIGDDVEVGANSCIDCGTIRDTRIGNGTKIDNLVHIAHNVQVGNDCLFAGQVGIAGSTVIGNHVVMGGQVGVSDNITIGDNVIAGGASKILTKVPAGRVVLGYPAMKMDTHIDVYKSLRRLPRMMREFAALQKRVSKDPTSD